MDDKKALKLAISNLPQKEKDKLIHRLLLRDKVLNQKLFFELVSTDTVDDRRLAIEKEITDDLTDLSMNLRNLKYYLKLVRQVSAKITLHFKITSDKFGEVALNLQLIAGVLEQIHEKYPYLITEMLNKIFLYIIHKLFRIMGLTLKLHEDYWLDLQKYYEKIHRSFLEYGEIKQFCDYHQFNPNWLHVENIPKNILEIHRNLKSSGYLK